MLGPARRVMPHKILASQRARYWSHRQQGHSIRAAARKANFSESYAKKLEREGIGEGFYGRNVGTAKAMREIDAEVAARPKRLDELSEVARDCLDDFGRFRARYLGSVSAPWQEQAAETVIRHLEIDLDSYGVINCPQGSGKTRLFSHDIPAWLTARDRTIRGILGSHGRSVSESMTGNLRTTLSRTSPALAALKWKRRGMAMDAQATLSDDYGRFRPVMSGVKWQRNEFEVEQLWTPGVEGVATDLDTYGGSTQDKEPTWAAFSVEAGFLSWRVDFMNWDDVHTRRMLANQKTMDGLYAWWDDEAESRLDPGGLCLVTMQRLGANDISKYLLDKIDPDFEINADQPEQGPRQYFHIVYKAHYDDRCQGQHGKDAPRYPDGCMLEPTRVTWQKIRAKKAAGNYEIVFQQEDVDPATVLVRRTWVDGGVDPLDHVDYPGCWDNDREIGELPFTRGGAIRYICVDPSPTKYWAVHDYLYVPEPGGEEMTGRRYLIDVERVRMGANELLDWANDHQSWTGLLDEWVLRARDQQIPVGTLIFEKNAAQRWALQYEHFRRWQQVRGVQVISHETMGNKADPELGIEAKLPLVYKTGRVRLPGKGVLSRNRSNYLVKEVTSWPNGVTDDQVMAQWFGEVHLPTFVQASQTIRSTYDDIPSWFTDRPPRTGDRVFARASR